jgi:hypothetical protein
MRGVKDDQIRAFLCRREDREDVFAGLRASEILAWVAAHGLPDDAALTRADGCGGGIHLVRVGLRWHVYYSDRTDRSPPDRFFRLRAAELCAVEIMIAFDRDRLAPE